jgi:HK97 family phage major capsid protein
VSDTTAPAPAVEEAVEAAKVEAAAPRPAFYATPRLEFTKAKYLEASIRAKVFGDEDSRQYVLAADDTTTNNAGLIPTPQSTEIINGLSNADRGVINGLSREVLPAAGMTFEIPKITAVPTMAVVAEEGAITETGMTNSFISVPVKAFKGGQEFSVELLDRSSPAFFNELVRQMEFAYAKATSDYVLTRLVAVGGAYGPAANTAAGLVGYVSGAAAEAYQNSLGFARSLVVSPTQWGNIMGYNDSGRPIYNATQPQNAAGNVGPTSITGQVLGLNLIVDRNIGVTAGTSADSDLSMVVINPDAYTWYEGAKTTLRTDVLGTGQIKVAIVGYGALAEKLPLAAVWNDIAV